MNISSVSSTTITRLAPVGLDIGTGADFEPEAWSGGNGRDDEPAATLDNELTGFWTGRGRGRGAMGCCISVRIFLQIEQRISRGLEISAKSRNIIVMDPPPVLFKRKGTVSKPSQRSKEIPRSNVVDSEANVEESPSILATRLKKKIQKSRPKSRLSFGGEDEEVRV